MAKLSSKKRNRLKSSQFALPGKRKDPIPDKSHAKAALTMGMRGASSSEKAEIRKRVHAKFPSVGASSRKKAKGKKMRKRVSGKR